MKKDPKKDPLALQKRIQLKRVLEALLFSSAEPISVHKMHAIAETVSPLSLGALRTALEALQEEYEVQQKPFRLIESAQGFILKTLEEFSPYVEMLGRNKRVEKLSQPAAEVLAIIAYRQPITRAQIEAIRGVDSSGTLSSLMERELIMSVGRLEAPGRPTLYGVTKEFLHHFGLKDVKDLSTQVYSSGEM